MEAQELFDWMTIGNKSVYEASIHFNVDIKDAQRMYAEVYYGD